MSIAADIVGADRHLLPTGFADQVHASWPRHNLGYALAEVIADLRSSGLIRATARFIVTASTSTGAKIVSVCLNCFRATKPSWITSSKYNMST